MPLAPFGLRIQRLQPVSAVLAWDPVPGADLYQVLVNGRSMGTTTGTSMLLAPLVPRSRYWAQVIAYAAGEASAPSTPVYWQTP